MSMAMAGGGLRHGQVIGATEPDGGHIKERPVTPGDLAATIYHHMGVPLDATYLDGTGRPALHRRARQPDRRTFLNGAMNPRRGRRRPVVTIGPPRRIVAAR